MASLYSNSNSASGMGAGSAVVPPPQPRDATEYAIAQQASAKPKSGLSTWGSPQGSPSPAPAAPHHHTHKHGNSSPAPVEYTQRTAASMPSAAAPATTPEAAAVRQAIGAAFATSLLTYDVPFSVGADYSAADIAAGKKLTVDMVSSAALVGVKITDSMSMIVEKVTVTAANTDLPVVIGAEIDGLGGLVHHSASNGSGKTMHFSLGSRDISSKISRTNPLTIDPKISDSVPPHQLKIWGMFKDKNDLESEVQVQKAAGVAYIPGNSRLFKSLITPVLTPDGKSVMIKPIAAQFGAKAKPHMFTDGVEGMEVELAEINAAIEALDAEMFQKKAFQSKRTDASKLDISLKLLNTEAAESLAQHNKEAPSVQEREMGRGSDIHIGGVVRITLLQ